MNILVTGAAGYIGSITTEQLVKEGHFVIAVDNLKQGCQKAVTPKATFIQADLADLEKLNDIFHHYAIEAVIHLAAYSCVEQSMSDPQTFFQNNIVCGINLLNTMLEFNVCKIVFSSTAAVYGESVKMPIDENDPKVPVNSYGESKLMFEKILHWYGHAYGLKSISLRYFNAAGASKRFGENHNPETHLIPNVLKVALGQCECVPIFGTDYDTKDGTCVRDYIHVLDIARAHILSLEHLKKGGSKVYNLGNGKGYSVLEVIEAARKVTSAQIPTVIRQKRDGDPALLIASSELAKCELRWHPHFSDLGTIVESAWQWQKTYSNGYR